MFKSLGNFLESVEKAEASGIRAPVAQESFLRSLVLTAKCVPWVPCKSAELLYPSPPTVSSRLPRVSGVGPLTTQSAANIRSFPAYSQHLYDQPLQI